MPIATLAQRNTLAAAYGTAAPYGALFTGAGPGSTGAATNELTGGSPAYTRKALNWATPAASAINSAATPFDVGAGASVSFFGVAAGQTSGTADVRDVVAVTAQTFASQGTYTVTATYTQS